MAKLIQLSLPVADLKREDPPLLLDHEREIVSRMAELLLQILTIEKGKEADNDGGS